MFYSNKLKRVAKVISCRNVSKQLLSKCFTMTTWKREAKAINVEMFQNSSSQSVWKRQPLERVGKRSLWKCFKPVIVKVFHSDYLTLPRATLQNSSYTMSTGPKAVSCRLTVAYANTSGLYPTASEFLVQLENVCMRLRDLRHSAACPNGFWTKLSIGQCWTPQSEGFFSCPRAPFPLQGLSVM